MLIKFLKVLFDLVHNFSPHIQIHIACFQVDLNILSYVQLAIYLFEVAH